MILPFSLKLNFFQQLMLRWSQELPYNAIHVTSIQGHIHIENWQYAIGEILNQVGIGIPHIQNNTHVQFQALKSVTIHMPQVLLKDYLPQELNYRFQVDECPLRFFIIPYDNESYYFGMTYNHWLADAYAIRKLLQHMIAKYHGSKIEKTLTLQAPEFVSLFRKQLGWSLNTLWLREMLRGIQLFFRAHRLHLTDKKNFDSQYVLRTLSCDTIKKLKFYSQEKKVSVNDIFIAILAQIMGKISASSRYQKKSIRRNRIAISTIADIRHAANQSLDNVMGQYLSSYTVVLATPEQDSIENLIEKVKHSTYPLKKKSRMTRSHYNFAAAVKLWDQNPKRRTQLFYKYAPIYAGISNIHVREEWHEPAILDYWRVSPTGPLAPIVFSLTTFQEKLTVCLAYRCSALSKQAAEEVCRMFCQHLMDL